MAHRSYSLITKLVCSLATISLGCSASQDLAQGEVSPTARASASCRSAAAAARDADPRSDGATPADGGSNDVSDGATAPGSTTPGSTMPTGPSLGGCPMFPADNAWNEDISTAPVHASSAAYIASMGASTAFHPDWSSTSLNAPYGYGIPYVVVSTSQPMVPITFLDYASQSDAGPYPIPAVMPIEGAESSTGDRHGLVLDTGTCYLYEVYQLASNSGAWVGAAGAIWHMKEDWSRPAGWTSADAAGLPILPGLVRNDEVTAGEIRHALRFTAVHTQAGYIAPASHFASSSTDASLPPMGLRVRLKANVDISTYSPRMQVILRALKRYGMLLADNGSNWYVTGAPDAAWDDDELNTLKNLHGSDFEAVDTGPIQH